MNFRIWPFLLLVAATAAHAETYRWVDAEGKVHYSDQPPPANARQVEKRKSTVAKPGEAPLPYVLQQAVKNFPVTLYATDCGDGCDRARKLLATRGIPYTEKDANDAETQEELKKLIGANLEVPVLKVGRTVVRGIEESGWNSALDVAGYPQTAVIPPRPPTRPAKAPPATPAPATAEAEEPETQETPETPEAENSSQ
jgi:glutaredoxin